MNEDLRLQRYEDLNVMELAALEQLFDSEYLNDYGRWNPNVSGHEKLPIGGHENAR